MNSLLKQGSASNANEPMSMVNALNNIKNDPIQFLRDSGFSVPNNLGNNPQSMIQYLLNSGQATQQMVNQYMKRIGW